MNIDQEEITEITEAVNGAHEEGKSYILYRRFSTGHPLDFDMTAVDELRGKIEQWRDERRERFHDVGFEAYWQGPGSYVVVKTRFPCPLAEYSDYDQRWPAVTGQYGP